MFSVLTFNIWNHEGPWQARLALIRDWIRLLAPDLIGMQEVLLGDGYDQAAEIFDGFDYRRAYAGPMSYWNDESLQFGNLIATRWPLAETGSVLLPMDGLPDQRVLLSARVESPEGCIPFYTTHLTSKPDDGQVREQQVRAIARVLREQSREEDLPAILCGDFNARPDAAEIRFLRGLQSLGGESCYLYDAWEVAGGPGPGHTFTRGTPYRDYRQVDQRLDYIFMQRAPGDSVRIAQCRLVCDLPRRGVYPSDHFGLYAEIDVQR